MAKTYDYKFIVEGPGDFPLDMLRYDRCTPNDETDSNTAQGGHERRRVTLRKTSDRLHWEPTVGRWSSFGWSVIAVERVG